MKITNQEMLNCLRRAAGIAGEDIMLKDYEKLRKMNGWPSANTIRARFGGWNKAKEKAGLKLNRSRKFKERKESTFCYDCLDKRECQITELVNCPYYDSSHLYFMSV